MQVDYIREKAKKLGLDPGTSSNHEDNLRTIAKQLGLDYDLLPSLNILDKLLDEMLIEQGLDEVEELLDIPVDVDDILEEETSEDEERSETENNDDSQQEKNNDEKETTDKNTESKGSEENTNNQEIKSRENTNASQGKGDKQPKESSLPKEDNVDKPQSNLRNKFQSQKDALNNKTDGLKNKAKNLKNPGEALKGKIKTGVKDGASKVGSKAASVGKNAGKAVSAGAKKAGAAVAKGAKAVGSLIAGGVKAIAGAIASNPYAAAIVIVVIVVIIIILLIIFLFMSYSGTSDYIGLYGYDYIEPKCTKITISGGEYAGVYDLEDYIAGVVNAEYGGFVNDKQREAAKAGAVAARSFVLANVNDNCTVESSQNFQVYKAPTEETKKIAQETRGLVLVESGSIKSTQYDAFCTKVAQTDPDYYIVCQKEQKIPRAWVDSQGGNILDSWKAGTMSGAHGNGMSQWGAAYLAEAEGYKFEDLLAYYYDTAEIMSIYKSFGYNGEYSIDPKDSLYNNLAFLKDQSFEEFLTSKGSTIEEYNTYLSGKIKEAGVGTRDGVVNAAVTLIGSLAEMGIKINYQWAGKYYQVGVNPNWGSPASTLCDNYAASGYDKSVCTTNYKWSGFDCSGFVNWAFINGMQNTKVATQYTQTAGGTELSASSAVCKPGGVLVSEGHIVLVVATDDEKKNYIVAEATGSRIALGTGGVKLSNYSYDQSGYVCKNLDEIYGE